MKGMMFPELEARRAWSSRYGMLASAVVASLSFDVSTRDMSRDVLA